MKSEDSFLIVFILSIQFYLYRDRAQRREGIQQIRKATEGCSGEHQSVLDKEKLRAYHSHRVQEEGKRWSDRGGGKTCRIDDNPKQGDDSVSAQHFSLKPMLQLGKPLFRFQCCEWHRDRMIWESFGIRGNPRCKWWLFRSCSSL